MSLGEMVYCFQGRSRKGLAILIPVVGLLAGFMPWSSQATDLELLNRLAGPYASRMNTALYVFDVGSPRPDLPNLAPLVFTGPVTLPSKEGRPLKGILSLASSGDFLLVSRIHTIRPRQNSARYFGDIIFKPLDGNIGLTGTYTGRLRATASARGLRREKLAFRVKLTQIVEPGVGDPQVYRLLGQFRGTK